MSETKITHNGVEEIAPDTEGEWRYVETQHSAEVAIDLPNLCLRIRPHWTGLATTTEIQAIMAQIVADHKAVKSQALLVEALKIADLALKNPGRTNRARPGEVTIKERRRQAREAVRAALKAAGVEGDNHRD